MGTDQITSKLSTHNAVYRPDAYLVSESMKKFYFQFDAAFLHRAVGPVVLDTAVTPDDSSVSRQERQCNVRTPPDMIWTAAGDMTVTCLCSMSATGFMNTWLAVRERLQLWSCTGDASLQARVCDCVCIETYCSPATHTSVICTFSAKIANWNVLIRNVCVCVSTY
jgi:hypothetical protein